MNCFVLRVLVLLAVLLASTPGVAAERLLIAAAADLKFCMDEIVVAFRTRYPDAVVETAYGASGNLSTQIAQGAPYDVFFSADIAFPAALVTSGNAMGPIHRHALGRIVLWSQRHDASALTIDDLVDARFRRIAIANPRHAPYGMRAAEALRARKIWDAVESKLVYGENVAQTAQFVQSGNADIGIIALSLALHPEFGAKGSYALIDDSLHTPLDQGFVVTAHGNGKPLAHAFATFAEAPEARAIMRRYGFALPDDAAP